MDVRDRLEGARLSGGGLVGLKRRTPTHASTTSAAPTLRHLLVARLSPQGPPFDVGHDEEVQPARLSHIVHRAEVLVPEAGDRASFSTEAVEVSGDSADVARATFSATKRSSLGSLAR